MRRRPSTCTPSSPALLAVRLCCELGGADLSLRDDELFGAADHAQRLKKEDALEREASLLATAQCEFLFQQKKEKENDA